MSQIKSAIRINESNENHHLYSNRGTWWLNITVILGNNKQKRIRLSLKTDNLKLARKRRDIAIKTVQDYVKEIEQEESFKQTA